MDRNKQSVCNDKYSRDRIQRRLDIVPAKYTLMYGKKYFMAINIHTFLYTHSKYMINSNGHPTWQFLLPSNVNKFQ